GAATCVAVAMSTQQPWHLATLFLFGAMVMPLYAISLATAADVSAAEEFVEIGTSVLMLNAIGAASAPLLLGQLMSFWGDTALFWSFAATCALFAVYLALQTREARAVTVQEQTPFAAAASEMAPASFELDPRGPDHPEDDPQHTAPPPEQVPSNPEEEL
ncbi:MAG: MFS transporter, partial [Halioglobus sp.]|nr:MFS transporter [Halioglobus sp.]